MFKHGDLIRISETKLMEKYGENQGVHGINRTLINKRYIGNSYIFNSSEAYEDGVNFINIHNLDNSNDIFSWDSDIFELDFDSFDIGL